MRFIWAALGASMLHVSLWLIWTPYSYGLRIPLPPFLYTIVIRLFHYHQLEDIGQVRRYSWLIAGWIAWLLIAVLVTVAVRRARLHSDVYPQ